MTNLALSSIFRRENTLAMNRFPSTFYHFGCIYVKQVVLHVIATYFHYVTHVFQFMATQTS